MNDPGQDPLAVGTTAGIDSLAKNNNGTIMLASEILAGGSLLLWIVVLSLPWFPWKNREVLNVTEQRDFNLDQLTVVIPARDEADVIRRTLDGLYRQSAQIKVILVDDNSSDATAAIASESPLNNLKIIQGQPLPPGWSGKLWAQHQGLTHVDTPLVLLLDADIYLDQGILATLIKKKSKDQLQLVSLMAKPSLGGFWERALMPAFVYFFKLLYPFALANSSNINFAAAAGGCILMDTDILHQIGGLESMKEAIIDDCTLAKRVKMNGSRTWTGLTLNVHSQRPYRDLSEIWNMVARTAFTQLRYSRILLGLCIVIMAEMFLAPLLMPWLSGQLATVLVTVGFIIMAATYLPTLKFYGRNPAWIFALPIIAILFLGMTWTSAWRFWNGEKSRWKNRIYENAPLTEKS